MAAAKLLYPDNSRQRKAAAGSKHGAKPAEQVPARAVLQIKMLTQTHRADRLARAQHQVHGEIPNAHRQVRAFKGRPDRHAELFFARVAAIISRPWADLPGFADDAAMRANRAVRPAHAFHMCAAGFVSSESSQEGCHSHQLSKKIEKGHGNGYSRNPGSPELKDNVLANAGISTQQASDWERLSEVPDDQFEAALAIKSVRDLIDKPTPVSSDALGLYGMMRTLEAIFARPVPLDIRWEAIEALLVALGAGRSEGRSSRVRFLLNGAEEVFPPRPGTDKGAVVRVRQFLETAGVKP